MHLNLHQIFHDFYIQISFSLACFIKAFTYFVQTTALCVCLLIHVEITSLTKENHMIEDPRKFEVENK
jgi:hypothetical protein